MIEQRLAEQAVEKTNQQEITEIWQLFRETDAKFKETDAKFKETDARLDKLFQETDQRIKSLESLFGTQWGKMLEALVHPGSLKLFQERGIDVHYSRQRSYSQHNGDSMEIDIWLENETELVLIEVKSKLGVQEVDDYLEDLATFHKFFPKYIGYRIYGAVAGLDIQEEADRYAYRRGLFVMRLGGDGIVQIKNDMNFKPRNFGTKS